MKGESSITVLVVGENGPEIVNLPRGAKVTPLSGKGDGINYEKLAAAIAKALGGGTGKNQEIHLHVGTLIGDKGGLRQMARTLKSYLIEEDIRRGGVASV